MAKDFTATKNRVKNTIAEATADTTETVVQEESSERKERKTYTEQEAQEFMTLNGTSGRKGLHLPRINMAFTPANYDYIQTMSRVRGETITAFVNRIMDESREANNELYQSAVEFRKKFL